MSATPEVVTAPQTEETVKTAESKPKAKLTKKGQGQKIAEAEAQERKLASGETKDKGGTKTVAKRKSGRGAKVKMDEESLISLVARYLKKDPAQSRGQVLKALRTDGHSAAQNRIWKAFDKAEKLINGKKKHAVA